MQKLNFCDVNSNTRKNKHKYKNKAWWSENLSIQWNKMKSAEEEWRNTKPRKEKLKAKWKSEHKEFDMSRIAKNSGDILES